MPTGASGCCPSSSPSSPGRSCATTRPTSPKQTSSRPPCGRRLERVPVSGEDAEELGRQITELAGSDATRFLGVNKLFDDHHPPGSYWYLQFMGVSPAWQGRGIGSALMAPVLARCDREGVRAYLDATSQRNKRLYERHGFQAEEAFAPSGGPPIWPMWRQPAPAR
jgi:GNAT superfamily N-acetyltransferase